MPVVTVISRGIPPLRAFLPEEIMWLVIPDECVGLFPKAWGGNASVL